MAILRNSFAALLRTTPSSEDADSGPFRLRPTDGDPTEDASQSMFAFIYCEQQGEGSVTIEVLGSFGDGVWAVFGQRTLTADAEHILDLEDIPSIPPYIRARVTALPPEGSEVKPTFACVFRIASNAPFRAEPANVPVIFERYPTEDLFDDGNNNGPDGGDGGGVVP